MNRETLQKFLRSNYCRYKCRFTKFLSPNRLALKMKLMKTLLVLVVTVLTLCESRHIRDWPQSVSSFPLLFIFFSRKNTTIRSWLMTRQEYAAQSAKTKRTGGRKKLFFFQMVNCIALAEE